MHLSKELSESATNHNKKIFAISLSIVCALVIASDPDHVAQAICAYMKYNIKANKF